MSSKLKICIRPKNETVFADLVSQGVSIWMADLLSRRVDKKVSAESCLTPRLQNIASPATIPDMAIAVDRICKAIVNEEQIILAVDHDMDGQGSAAVLWCAFVDHFQVPAQRLSVVTSHRLTEGYGITPAVVERILATEATLVISADKGSSDEPRIRLLAKAGRDVVVTDHHQIPQEGPPPSALACVNPARSDSEYDPYICGAAVAFMTMAMVRTELLKKKYLPSIPSLASLLDYVAVATVADCVSMRPDKSYTNRALVKKGMALINAQNRPCWKVFCEDMRDPEVTSQTIGFQLAPAVAAAGRLDWAEVGFRFLVADNRDDAEHFWQILKSENELRKQIEKDLRCKAVEAARHLNGQSIVLYFEEGHSGVHGITASRLVEKFGKPAAMFAPKGAGSREPVLAHSVPPERRLASGSFRGIPGFDTRAALQYVDDHYPGILLAFGGHAGAAGATVAMEDIDDFRLAYEEAVNTQLVGVALQPELWIDGDVAGAQLTLDSVDMLSQLDPWGRDFQQPAFCSEFSIEHVRTVGDGTHLKLLLKKDGSRIDGIWFNAKDSQKSIPVEVGKKAKLAFKMSDNIYRNQRSFQIQILALVDS